MTTLKPLPWLAIPLLVLGCASAPLWSTTLTALTPIPAIYWSLHADAGSLGSQPSPDAGANR